MKTEDDWKSAGWVVAVILGIILFFVWTSSGSNSTSSTGDSSDGSSGDLQSQLDDATSCISDANDYISGLQSTIDDAASNADGTYDDMNSALGNLQYDSAPTCLGDY